MKISTSAAPLLFAVTMLVAAGGAVAQANAGEARLSDVGYINAARCAGLAQGVGAATIGYDRVLNAQGNGREDVATYLADEARTNAAREAGLSPYWRAQATAQAGGACQTYLDRTEARMPVRTSHGEGAR